MPGYMPLTPQGNQNIVNQQANNNALITALRRRQSLPAGYAPQPMLQAPQAGLNMANFTDMMNRYNYGNALQQYQNSPQGYQNQWLASVSKNPQQYQTPNFNQWMQNGQVFGPQTFSGVFGPFGRGFGNNMEGGAQ